MGNRDTALFGAVACSVVAYRRRTRGGNRRMVRELEEARSLVPGTFGNFDLELLEVHEKEEDIWYYYRSKSTGDIFYTTRETEEFDKKMKEAERRRKECSRRSWRR